MIQCVNFIYKQETPSYIYTSILWYYGSLIICFLCYEFSYACFVINVVIQVYNCWFDNSSNQLNSENVK